MAPLGRIPFPFFARTRRDVTAGSPPRRRAGSIQSVREKIALKHRSPYGSERTCPRRSRQGHVRPQSPRGSNAWPSPAVLVRISRPCSSPRPRLPATSGVRDSGVFLKGHAAITPPSLIGASVTVTPAQPRFPQKVVMPARLPANTWWPAGCRQPEKRAAPIAPTIFSIRESGRVRRKSGCAAKSRERGRREHFDLAVAEALVSLNFGHDSADCRRIAGGRKQIEGCDALPGNGAFPETPDTVKPTSAVTNALTAFRWSPCRCRGNGRSPKPTMTF